MSKRWALLCLFAVITIASFTRLWNIKNIPPGFSYDEASYANNAVETWQTGNFKVFYSENNGREGLWINILAPVLGIFGNEPWIARSVAAIFGILTVLGLYFLTRELFKSERIALLASFFLAVSFWHINFSRIAFRAILAPFFLVWSFYFLWKTAKKLSAKSLILLSALAGLFFGLGFHAYISYRVAPLLLIIPFLMLWRANQKKLIFIFLAFAILAALPMGLYFAKNPADFLGRSSQISVFSSQTPLFDLGKNILKTVEMFFWQGDLNWRHNFNAKPQLWWPVAILFLIGILESVRRAAHREKIRNFFLTGRERHWFILIWLVVMLIPAITSNEGMPHALRGIVAIPAVMILAALGLETIIVETSHWHHKKIERHNEHIKQLTRIKKHFGLLVFVFLIAVASQSFNQYFFKWSVNANVARAFDKNFTDLANYINSLPKDVSKYIIMNYNNDRANNFYPPPAITFITNTYVVANQIKNNISYINPAEIGHFIQQIKGRDHFYITMLDFNGPLRLYLKSQISGLQTINPALGIVALYR